MGTRNLTMVINKIGNLKVAQYGKWNGYPSGNGVKILEFCRNKDNLIALKNNINSCKFYNDDKKFIEEFDSRANKNELTESDNFLWNNYQSRDVGAKILRNIAYCDYEKLGTDKIQLYNEIDFGKDSLMCEWAYCVNFNTNKLMCFEGFN